MIDLLTRLLAQTGQYGTGSDPLDIATEIAHLEPRTSDPSSYDTPALWYREDLTDSVSVSDGSGNQLGTLRWDDGSGIENIPIIEPDTSESDVYEPLQVQTPNGQGYIPISSNGRFDLRIQHNSEEMQWHNNITVGSDLHHIETQEANSDSTIDFTNVFSSSDGYDRYLLFADNPVLDSTTNFEVRVSSDGGSTWDSGSSDYAWADFQVLDDGTTSANGSGSDNRILTVDNLPTTSESNAGSGILGTVADPTNSNRATVIRTGGAHYDEGGSQFSTELAGGIRLAQSAVDSIQLYPSSGNIESGIFSVYGVSQ